MDEPTNGNNFELRDKLSEHFIKTICDNLTTLEECKILLLDGINFNSAFVLERSLKNIYESLRPKIAKKEQESIKGLDSKFLECSKLINLGSMIPTQHQRLHGRFRLSPDFSRKMILLNQIENKLRDSMETLGLFLKDEVSTKRLT